MIDIFPDGFLSSAVMIGIAVTTVSAAALATMRWNWKALPLALFGGVAMPILVPVAVMIVTYYVDVYNGEAGSFSFHLNNLIFFVGLPSALLGFGGVLAVRRFQSAIR